MTNDRKDIPSDIPVELLLAVKSLDRVDLPSSLDGATGHPFFNQIRQGEVNENDPEKFVFVRDYRRWLVPLDVAAKEVGVPDGVLIELALQRKTFLVFHRPAGIEVRRVAQYVQHYDEREGLVQPDFLVLPSEACFDLHFNDEVDLLDVKAAMSFSPTWGLSPVDLEPERPDSVEPLNEKLNFSMNAKADDWRRAWGCWGFLRNGKKSTVTVAKKSLFLPAEELGYVRELVRQGKVDEVESCHSSYLQAMLETSRKFWIESGVVANNFIDSPTWDEVRLWLMNQYGMSKSLAKAAASLIRPEDAPDGRPRAVRSKKSSE